MALLKRILAGVSFGSFLFLIGWALDIYFARLGISPADTFLDDLIVGTIAAFLAYAWVTHLAERHLREQTAAKIKQEAVLEERSRMAREFHDTVAQSLSGVVIQLEAGDILLSGHPAATKCLLRAAELAREGLREARESVWNLRPEALEGSNLPSAIGNLAKGLADRMPIRVEFSFEGSVRQLPGSIEKDFLRIAQEALNNIVKHAHASNVNVKLALSDEQLQLAVEDDGVGFTPECQPVEVGFGLTSMRDRARTLGGICWFYSQPGRGTSVQAIVPLGPVVS